MSRRHAAACAVLLALGAGGCASSGGMQVSRLTRQGVPPDTARWRDVANLPQRDPSHAYTSLKAPADEAAPRDAAKRAGAKRATKEKPSAPPPAATVTPPASRDTTAAVSVARPLSVEPAIAPRQPDGDDPFDTTFIDAGRVVDVDDASLSGGGDDGSPPAPAPRDRVPAPQTPPRVRNPLIAPRESAAGRGAQPPPTTPDAGAADEAEPAARGYAVQLHAFPTRVAAEFAARQAGRALGVATRVRVQPTSSLPYKVVAGHYATRAAATDLRERAVRQGFPEAWVVADPDGAPR